MHVVHLLIHYYIVWLTFVHSIFFSLLFKICNIMNAPAEDMFKFQVGNHFTLKIMESGGCSTSLGRLTVFIITLIKLRFSIIIAGKKCKKLNTNTSKGKHNWP